MTETQHTLRPDFHLIVMSVDLEYWNLAEYEKYVEAIESVWLFDKNVQVHCCEVTPSYELWPVYGRVVFKDSFDQEVNESLRDKIEEDLLYWIGDEVEYHHVRDIERLLAKDDTRQHPIGDFMEGVSYDDESYDDQRGAAIEYYRANHCL